MIKYMVQHALIRWIDIDKVFRIKEVRIKWLYQQCLEFKGAEDNNIRFFSNILIDDTIDLKMYYLMCMYLSVCMLSYVFMSPWEPEEDTGFSRTGVTVTYKAPQYEGWELNPGPL